MRSTCQVLCERLAQVRLLAQRHTTQDTRAGALVKRSTSLLDGASIALMR